MPVIGQVHTADAQGQFALHGGAGFLLEPYGPDAQFPVTVEPDTGGAFQVFSSRSIAVKTPFRSLKVTGARAGSQWFCTVFADGDWAGGVDEPSRAVRLLHKTDWSECLQVTFTDGTYFLGREGVWRKNTFGATGIRYQTPFDVSPFRQILAVFRHPALFDAFSQWQLFADWVIGDGSSAGELGEDPIATNWQVAWHAFGSSAEFGAGDTTAKTGYLMAGQGLTAGAGTHDRVLNQRWPFVRFRLTYVAGAPLDASTFAGARFLLYGIP